MKAQYKKEWKITVYSSRPRLEEKLQFQPEGICLKMLYFDSHVSQVHIK